MKITRYMLAFVIPLFFAVACSSQAVKEQDGDEQQEQQNVVGLNPSDPWEGFNRSIFSFNEVLDKYISKPIAIGYDTVTPDAVQSGVRNFFSNLGEVYSLVNNVLQLDFQGAGTAVMRFTVNTIFGLYGLLDVASEVGMDQDAEDFGQTLAVWGFQQGNYLMLPIFGPSTTRDIFGYSDSIYYNRYLYVTSKEEEMIGLTVLDLIQQRTDLLPLEDSIVGDRYIFIRDAYLQNREFRVNDGVVATDDFVGESEDDEQVSDDDF